MANAAMIHFSKIPPNVHFCASEVSEKHLMEKPGLRLEYDLPLDTLLFRNRNTHPIFALCITKVIKVSFPRASIFKQLFLRMKSFLTYC